MARSIRRSHGDGPSAIRHDAAKLHGRLLDRTVLLVLRFKTNVGLNWEKRIRVGQNRTLRIGLDGDVLGRRRTGDESYLTSLMRGLHGIDEDNEYVVYVRDAEAVASMFPELPRFGFESVRPQSIWFRYALGLPWLLRRRPVDLLHVQYFIPPMTPCPTVLTVHDLSFVVHPEFFSLRDRVLLQRLVPKSMRRADRIITDMEITKQDMVRIYGVDPERIEVIPLAADLRYRPMDREVCRESVAKSFGVDGPFVLYVGTFQPRKNVEPLIRGYTQMREQGDLQHKLVLVGKPKHKYESVFEAIETSPFRDDIILTGFVEDDDLPVFYNAADVFVFPTLFEGFGLPVVEAMACGTPVITTNVSCLPDVSGGAAMLVDPNDPEAFATAMTSVLSDETVAQQMAERGLAHSAGYSWERTARETVAVYRKVLGEGNGASCSDGG